MTTEPYITASCTISNNNVYKNGQLVYADAGKEPVDFFASVYRHIKPDYPRFYKMDNLAKLGWLAAEILLRDSFDASAYKPEQTGLILCNANASLDTDIKYLATTNEIASPSVFVYTLPNIMTGEICIRHQFKGDSSFFIAEEFDASFLQQYVNGLMKNDILQACICGWVELLEKEYKAVLFLVEKKETATAVAFDQETMQKIFEAENK